MGTTTRPELSKKNKYYVEKHRFYELKHFCLQYPIWQKAYLSLDSMSRRPEELEAVSRTNDISDPTAKIAMSKAYYAERIDMVIKACKETDSELWSYILQGVTEGRSYEYLKLRQNIPCCKDVYYELFRKFFYILNKTRN